MRRNTSPNTETIGLRPATYANVSILRQPLQKRAVPFLSRRRAARFKFKTTCELDEVVEWGSNRCGSFGSRQLALLR